MFNKTIESSKWNNYQRKWKKISNKYSIIIVIIIYSICCSEISSHKVMKAIQMLTWWIESFKYPNNSNN